MHRDVSIFNEHLAELERVTKKKVGLGPIGSYGGMALAVIPGFGWFSAAFSAISMGMEMLMGNKKKKRVNELMRIMQEAQERLKRNQQRLGAIQEEMRVLIGVTDRAKAGVESKRQTDTERYQYARMIHEQSAAARTLSLDQELARVRQAAPVRVRYANEF
jgi:TolA-binding protein